MANSGLLPKQEQVSCRVHDAGCPERGTSLRDESREETVE